MISSLVCFDVVAVPVDVVFVVDAGNVFVVGGAVVVVYA